MGKYIETKYSDVQNRVIKPIRKKRKIQHVSDKVPYLKHEEVNVDLDNTENEISSQLKYKVKENLKHHTLYISMVDKEEDLFSEDALKARYDQYTKFNFLYLIFDEIALEGLDGITIEALWKRISVTLKNPPNLQNIEDIIWKCICANKDIQFFELPEARGDLNISSRYDYVNEELGVFMELYNQQPDIYKIECAPKGDVWGSCATLQSRVDITDIIRGMDLKQALNIYKNKLVIVADQKLRTNALFHDCSDINYDIMPIEYCILEKIGRSREYGEITQGVSAVGIGFNMDSKSIHHYKKRLSKQNLITKQFFAITSVTDQSKIGSLLQLRRFYVKNKSKILLLTESVIHYLKKCPGHRTDFATLKKTFCNTIPSKFLKNPEILKYISTRNAVPYRDMYPNATENEYMIKGMTKERTVRTIQLKNPYINIVANWSDTLNAESSEDEDENDDSGYLIGKGRAINMEFSKELYLMIRSKELQGCSVREMNDIFDVDFPTIRSCIKKLVKADVVVIKRCDEGKQRHNQYIAKCIMKNEPVINYTQPENISTIEKLKQRQKQKMAALSKDQIYTQEQFEAERNLMLEKPSYLPVSLNIPSIICKYLIASTSKEKIAECLTQAQYSEVIKAFKLNLVLPDPVEKIKFKLAGKNWKEPTILDSDVRIVSAAIYINRYKPDYLMKAFLMLATLKNIPINRKDIIDFLNSNNTKKGESLKRKHSEIEIKTKNALPPPSVVKEDLLDYMGPSPVSILSEKGEYDVNIEMIMSTPPKEYVEGNITEYKVLEENLTERLLRRIRIILEEIQSLEICKEMKNIIKTIRYKEKEEGSNRVIDKKSLHRIIRKLVSEGYLKVFHVIISKDNLKRMEVFICHPKVNHNNEIITTQVQQVIWKYFGHDDRELELSTSSSKDKNESKISPFIRKDVQASIREVKCLKMNKHIAMKVISSRKSGKLYGYRPKYSKMSILHELLFYLIYVLDKKAQALTKVQTLNLFQSYQINLTSEDLDNLPPVYCKELSWKMFIPPLPQHKFWTDGWALICDIILRIPVSLITKLHCVSYYSSELQDILHHPIKRFYLLKNLPPQLHNIIMYRRKYIHNVFETIARLGYCGLVQFGPSKYQEKDQIFIYLNRKASLLETMTSEPSYHKVSLMDYNKLEFTFNRMNDLLKYWSSMYNICMNTPLNSRIIMVGKTIILEGEKTKPSLQKVFSIRTQEEARKLDNGNIPGDHRGAAGLDSALWSHIKRNWFSFGKGHMFKDDLESLKFDQVIPDQLSYEQLKLPNVPTKFFIPKPQIVTSTNLIKSAKMKPCKEVPLIKRKVPFRKRTKPPVVKKQYDDVDRAIFKKYKDSSRFKPSWSEEEDKLLIMLKIAAKFLNPNQTKTTVNNPTIRDILHRIIHTSQNKTASSIPRRWKILKRDIPSIVNIDFWVSNMYKLDQIQEYFLPLRNYAQKEKDDLGNSFKLSETEMQKAFVFLCFYIVTHRNEVEATLDGNMTTFDYFNSDNIESSKSNLVSIEKVDAKYVEPVDKGSIRKCILKNLFHSVLGVKKENPAWSYQLYKIYQKFSNDDLKCTIAEMKEQKMMTCKKDMIKKFHTPYKMGLHYIFSQCPIFTLQTMEEICYTFSSMKNDSLQLEQTDADKKNYGQLLALHEITTILWDKINMKFHVPENPFILNPNIEDHSEVIEELAKRYQAKLKNDQKELELQLSMQSENENVNRNSDLMPTTSTEDTWEKDKVIELDDDDEPLDLTVSTNTDTINSLKHWISDCIDTERVRSPSPELLAFDDGSSLRKIIKEEIPEHDNFLTEGDKILSVEEIKKEMLKVTSGDEKRAVPYITDLTKLLTENFEEIETEESSTDRLKKHFVQQYPSLSTFKVDISDSTIVDSLEHRLTVKNVLEKILKEQHVKFPSQPSKVIEKILSKHGTSLEDVDSISEIIAFIDEKKYLGATGQELKDKFLKIYPTGSLESILTTLTESGILIRTGICCIKFVHFSHASEWLIESFNLNQEHEDVDHEKFDKIIERIDDDMKITPWIKIKIQPWVGVDGKINKELIKLWLSNVLSYCVENPKITMTGLVSKFCFITPVDIYHLLEILQELGCLEIRRFLPRPVTLFSEFEIWEATKATFLDNFEDMFVDVNNTPLILLGNFLYNL